MKLMETIRSVLGSKALMIWLTGLFILYYISVAVWYGEAFARFIENLGRDLFFQFFYLLLALNVSIRIVVRMRKLWPEKIIFFLRLPLYAGVLLLLLSFFLSVNIRKSKWILAGEGDLLDIPWDKTPLQVAKVDSGLRKKTLITEDSFLFSSEPAITLLDRRNAAYRIGAFPPIKVGATYMHVLNFGIGPGIELREKEKSHLRTYVGLRLTPFGSVDKFELPPFPYTFYVSILPNRTIKKGRETAQEYDLEKPKYRVEVIKGDRTIAQAETEDQISFDGTMSLRFHQPSDWVLLDVAYDPFLPPFVIGLLLTMGGIALYPLHLLVRRGAR